jgi:hypothetical protein
MASRSSRGSFSCTERSTWLADGLSEVLVGPLLRTFTSGLLGDSGVRHLGLREVEVALRGAG